MQFDKINIQFVNDNICMLYMLIEKAYSSCGQVESEGKETKDGVYKLNIDGTIKEVFCDMTTEKPGAWTVGSMFKKAIVVVYLHIHFFLLKSSNSL